MYRNDGHNHQRGHGSTDGGPGIESSRDGWKESERVGIGGYDDTRDDVLRGFVHSNAASRSNENVQGNRTDPDTGRRDGVSSDIQ